MLNICDNWRTGRIAAAVSLFLPAIGMVGAARAQTVSATATASPNESRPGLLTEIPFTLRNNWIVLNVRVGKDAAAAAKAPALHFLLDTGATVTMLSQESLDANNLTLSQATDGKSVEKVIGSGDSSGVAVSNRVHATLFFIDSRQPIAPIPETLIVLPFGADFRRLDLDGLLGNSFISRFVTEVDYAAHVVRFYDPNKFMPRQAQDGFSTLPLHFDSRNLPWIDAEVTPLGYSTTAIRLTVDTGGGKGGAVTLYSPFVQKQNWQNVLPRTVPIGVSGLGGQTSSFIGRLRDIRLGGATVRQPSLIFSLTSKGLFAQSESDGQIGGDLLARFMAIFDYPHKMLYLRPDITTAFPLERYYGLHYVRPATASGGYRIERVDLDSPAAKAGIHAGDVLYTIDGRAVAGLDSDAMSDLWDASGAERTCEIGSADDKTRRQVKITGITY